MSELKERYVTVNGCRCRVWEKGSGPRIGFVPGYRGVPRWRRFFDLLAATQTVVVPSLPGFPGAEPGHLRIDETIDWISMTLDLLDAADLNGADLIGESVGGMLAAEAAALSPSSVRRLVLINSFGLYDPEEPVRNPFHTAGVNIPALFVADADRYFEAFGCQSNDPSEFADWEVLLYRADEAAARLMWPFGDRGLVKRLHRITAPTLLLASEKDQLVPPSYAERFAAAVANGRVVKLAGASHLASVDAPDAAATAVLSFLR